MDWILSYAMTFRSVVETELFPPKNHVKHNHFYFTNNPYYNMA